MAYSSEVLADSPHLYWRLGESSGTNVDDATANNRDGTIAGTNGLTLGVTGLLSGDSDTAFDFAGSGTTPKYVSNSTVGLSGSSITIECVVQTTDTTRTNVWIAGNHVSYFFKLEAGVPTFTHGRTTGTQYTATSSVGIADGEPHHLVGRTTGNVITIWVDGVQTGSTGGAGTLNHSNTAFVGWNSITGGVVQFDGVIDEFALYQSALSQARIEAHAAEVSPAAPSYTGSLAAALPPVEISLAGTYTPPPVSGTLDLSIPAVSVDLAGTYQAQTFNGVLDIGIPPVTVALSGSYVPPPISGTLDIGIPAVVVDLAGSFVGEGSEGVLDIQIPGVEVSLTGTYDGPIDTARNRTSGRQRNGVASWQWSPAVVAPPAHLSLAEQWVTAIAFDTPTIVNGRPMVSVTTATEPKLRHRITVGGVDVTFLYDVPTPPMDYQLVEPGMYAPGSLLLPQVYGYFQTPGEGDLSWLYDFAPVVQERIDAEGNVASVDYKGFVLTYDVGDDGLRIECGGELTGRLALTRKQISLYRNVYDIGRQVSLMVKNNGCAFAPVGGPETGIEIAGEGGTSSLDAFNRLNAQSAKRDGTQRSTMPDANGVYRFQVKDTSTIHATNYLHDGQSPASLRRDLSAEPSVAYGTGVAPSGERVMNAVYPGLALYIKAAPYPKAGGASFGVGTTDAETVNGDGITVMLTRLRQSGFLGAADSGGGYDDDAADAIQALQEQAGLPISLTGDMNQATWRALWDQDKTGYTMVGSEILPMAQKSYTRKWRRGASGAIIGRNPDYDGSIPPVHIEQDFGTAFRKPQMIRHSKRKIADASEPNWVGTMVLETGALIAGEHTPGDPITSILQATDIRPGMNIWLPLFMGGVLVHVSGVTVSDGQVTLQVDSRFRDTISVQQIIERNMESRRDLYATWVRSHLSSGNISDANPEWTADGGGQISDVQLTGGAWKAFPVVSGRSGTVGRLKIRTQAPTEFYMVVLGQGEAHHIERKLERRIGDPSTPEGKERWVDEDIRDSIDQENILLYVAGEPDNPCGYWPKRKSGESAILTGKWQDDAGFEYRTSASNVLWVAVWAEANAKIPGGRIMWPLLEPM